MILYICIVIGIFSLVWRISEQKKLSKKAVPAVVFGIFYGNLLAFLITSFVGYYFNNNVSPMRTKAEIMKKFNISSVRFDQYMTESSTIHSYFTFTRESHVPMDHDYGTIEPIEARYVDLFMDCMPNETSYAMKIRRHKTYSKEVYVLWFPELLSKIIEEERYELHTAKGSIIGLEK